MLCSVHAQRPEKNTKQYRSKTCNQRYVLRRQLHMSCSLLVNVHSQVSECSHECLGIQVIIYSSQWELLKIGILVHREYRINITATSNCSLYNDLFLLNGKTHKGTSFSFLIQLYIMATSQHFDEHLYQREVQCRHSQQVLSPYNVSVL